MLDLKNISESLFEGSRASLRENNTKICSLNPKDSIKACKLLLEVLLPGRFGSTDETVADSIFQNVTKAHRLLEKQLCLVLPIETALNVLEVFFNQLNYLRQMIEEDIHASFIGDPAAKDHCEVLLAYPGLLAISCHRLAHSLYQLEVPYIPRILNEWAHSKTGIDIHPGAKIEAGIFIDHGTGVVIGQTCKIGKNVKIYQGVTLGAKSFELDENGNPIKNVQRHPTVEDNVVIYANATILGGKTIIGKGAVVGGNVFITKSVEAGSKVSL